MKKLLTIIISCCSFTFYTNAQLKADIESGIVTTGYNDVRIPGDGGTMLSLNEELNAGSQIYYRIRLHYVAGDRHNFSLLYAPLTVKSDGYLPKDVNFAGVLFAENSSVDATYQFNSYRLTYRYDIVERPSFEFGLGFTAKIRDANIMIESNGLMGEKKNVGFVPIINFSLHWKPSERFGLLLQGDALAAPQGRAEDVLAAITYDFSDKFGIWAGYRILEGGADNDEVYTFSMFNYASIGLSISFW